MNWLKRVFVLGVLLGTGGALFGDTVQSAQSFAKRRKESGVKVEALRARLDAAGAAELPVAFVLAVDSPDARLVAATVLAFHLHKGKPVAVLMACAAKNARRVEPMMQVSDDDFKSALMQAPQEMDCISETYQALDDALALSAADFNRLTARAKALNPQARVQARVEKELKSGVAR